ncbi:MAG TPA: penicillin-binding protein 2 [Abditibacteriaceae bacterium]|nr:penicillin-binding protein 2 [Abditibacteriaceae bacterium]
MKAHPPGRRRQGSDKANSLIFASTQRRIEGTFYVLLMPLFFLLARLVQLQALPAPPHAGLDVGPEIFTQREVLKAPRGQILAADLTSLTVTLDEYTVAANPRAVVQKEKMAKRIALAIGGNPDDYGRLLQKTVRSDGKKNYYVRLAQHVDGDRIEKLRALMGPPKKKKGEKDETRTARTFRKKFWEPLSLEPTPRRQYPLGNFASQLIGFTRDDGHGADGLEAAWNRQLAGTDGVVISQVDTQRRPVPGFVKKWIEPKAGRSIVTTIDAQIQADTDAALHRLVQQYRPNFATAIVLRPRTGEIVAMSTAPAFDLNHRPANIVELATNRCLSFAYEPGSTFKIITAAAAVEKVPGWQKYCFTCNGVQRVGKHSMHCWISSTSKSRHGVETLSESIRDSCNFGVYGFARLAGAPAMLDYAKRFGLGRPIGIGGLQAHPGVLSEIEPGKWSQEQLANFAFGQGMMMTPYQLARAAGAIANDGVMMKPLLIKEVRNERGEVIRAYRPAVERRVIAPATARIVTGMMERVVREGTASKLVWVPGYQAAGKTGSAQKADGPRGYMAGKFISSFVGFVPSRRPEFVIVVMADEPHGSHWGSEVCGPTFATIAQQAMLRLRLTQGASAPAPSAALMVRPKKVSG